MNPSPDNFDALRRLLQLKRHEQPPPGFYDDFPRQVIRRIQAREDSTGVHWLVALWQTLTARPVLSTAAAFSCCALMVAGLLYSYNLKPDPAVAGDSGLAGIPGVTPAQKPAQGQGFYNEFLNAQTEMRSSTNPVTGTTAPPSLFGPIVLPVERAAFNTN
jgi:hypothetical protein